MVENQANRFLRQRFLRLPDSAQRHDGRGRVIDVVVANDGDVARDVAIVGDGLVECVEAGEARAFDIRDSAVGTFPPVVDPMERTTEKGDPPPPGIQQVTYREITAGGAIECYGAKSPSFA